MAQKVVPWLIVEIEWIELGVVCEPTIVLTSRGYTPTLRVQESGTGAEFKLSIRAKSIAQPLEALRQNNQGKFKGLHFRIRKRNKNPKSQYEIQAMPTERPVKGTIKRPIHAYQKNLTQ